MKLDLNFNSLTKLREWWKQVYNNFGIIEKECTETRKIADAACTKDEVEAYVAEFVGSSDEYMNAIEAFSALYQENQSSVTALEEIFGDRLRYYSQETEFDADTAADDAIYFCKSGTLNTPTSEVGILLSTSNAFQFWIAKNGDTYYRIKGETEWTLTKQTVLDTLSDLDDEIRAMKTTKSEVVFGTYTGNGSSERFIELGFTPVAVEVYMSDGLQTKTLAASMDYYGGLAIKDYPCSYGTHNIIQITDNGFYVYSNSYISSNYTNEVFYFKAYKNGEIMEAHI